MSLSTHGCPDSVRAGTPRISPFYAQQTFLGLEYLTPQVTQVTHTSIYSATSGGTLETSDFTETQGLRIP